jgi:putative ABC transport system permease protein
VVARYLTRALRAQLRGARALHLLAVAGVALGVAAVLSIQILSQSAVGAFAGSVRAVSGDSQLSVVGRGPTLPDALLPMVLAERDVRAAVPVYRLEVALPGGRGALEVVGTDLFAPVRVPWDLPRGALSDVLGRRGWVAVTPRLAAEMGWRRGAAVPVSSGSRRVTLEIGALVDFQRLAPLASRRLAVMDLAQAQALLGAPGRVTQIDVVAAPGADIAELARRLEARLGPGVRAVTPEQRVAEAGALLAAFRLNLTALSLVSLLVGGFLVYASTQTALTRRREELGVLRCLGATRGQVLGLVLADAALLGVLGTAAGIPLGWLAARANVGAVSSTVRTLYVLEGVEHVTLSPGLVALGAAMGLAGALVGALLPALDVVRQDPRALLAPLAAAPVRARPGAGRLAAAAALLVAGVAAAVLGPGRDWRWGGFCLALAVLAAVPLAVPLALRAAVLLPRPHRLGVLFGVRDLPAHLRATGVAAGALAIAVAMLVGITVMIGSFRQTLDGWLSATLRADVYVTTPSWRRGATDATLAPEVVARLAREPGVRAVEPLRQLAAEVGGRRVSVAGFDAGLEVGGRVQLLAGDRAEALRRLHREGAVLVSEPLARRARLRAGGEVEIAGPAGAMRLPVAGVYRDYGSESGAVLMDLVTLDARFGPGPLTNLALDLAAGEDADAVVARLRARYQGEALVVRSNRRLREDALGVFAQTFAVTRLLQGMGLVVAVSGVTLALLVLARERSAEVALFRSLGATRGQVFLIFVGRALGITVAGLALGALGGAGLALILVEIINPAWFGWTIDLHAPWLALAVQAAVLLVVALGASVYPALRASRTPATELSRDAL